MWANKIVTDVLAHLGCASAEGIRRAIGVDKMSKSSMHNVLSRMVRDGVLVRYKSDQSYIYEVAAVVPQKTEPAPPPVECVPVEPQHNASLDEMLSAMMNRLMLSLETKILNTVMGLVVDTAKETAEATIVKVATAVEQAVIPAVLEVPGEPKKKRVVVLGIHDNKKIHIWREYYKNFDLSMLTPDDNISRWKATAAGADEVLVLRDYVSHRHTEALKAAHIPFRLIAGGLSTLRSELTALTTPPNPKE